MRNAAPRDVSETAEEYAERLFREPVSIDLNVVKERIAALDAHYAVSADPRLHELLSIADDLLFRVRWHESHYNGAPLYAPTKAYNDVMMTIFDNMDFAAVIQRAETDLP